MTFLRKVSKIIESRSNFDQFSTKFDLKQHIFKSFFRPSLPGKGQRRDLYVGKFRTLNFPLLKQGKTSFRVLVFEPRVILAKWPSLKSSLKLLKRARVELTTQVVFVCKFGSRGAWGVRKTWSKVKAKIIVGLWLYYDWIHDVIEENARTLSFSLWKSGLGEFKLAGSSGFRVSRARSLGWGGQMYAKWICGAGLIMFRSFGLVSNGTWGSTKM